MYMARTARVWTADEVRALPDDGNRYEVVDGELLVTPAPARVHQEASRQLFRLLDEYARRTGIAEVYYAPADIDAGRMSLVQPDLFAVPMSEHRSRGDWETLHELLLVVEIISPSSVRNDRFTKRRLYQRERVPEYWIVDLDDRVIERWTPGDEIPERLEHRISWQPSDAHPPLDIELRGYFAAVLNH
jgi:Uma2 family endonuclease